MPINSMVTMTCVIILNTIVNTIRIKKIQKNPNRLQLGFDF